MKKKIGIIGCGNMGSAIAERIKRKYRVFIFDKDREKTKNLKNITIADNIINLAEKVDVVILAVKPQDFDAVLNEIKDYTKDKLIISIAAGITTNYIEKVLPRVRIIRVMPNLPARIGKGMICLSRGKKASRKDLDFAQRLFHEVGKTMVIKEEMMDADTAISGSGPGFFYALVSGKDFVSAKKFAKKEFLPALSKAAESIGFNKRDARELASVTTQGSVKYLEKSGLDAQTLKKQVASKGGTTEAGLMVLKKGGSLEEAVEAALNRAEELSRG